MSDPRLTPGGMLVVAGAVPIVAAATREGLEALQSPALQMVLAERVEQIERHGHDAHHDDLHDEAEIAGGAIAYLTAYRLDALGHSPAPALAEALQFWPWTPESFRPSGEAEMLAKAGALILAELDRVIRAQALLEYVR